MLARFRVLLPFTLSIREGDSLAPQEFDRDGAHFKVYPPYQTAANLYALVNPMVTLSDLENVLRPRTPVVVGKNIRIDDRCANLRRSHRRMARRSRKKRHSGQAG
jgi:hypothetical protein